MAKCSMCHASQLKTMILGKRMAASCAKDCPGSRSPTAQMKKVRKMGQHPPKQKLHRLQPKGGRLFPQLLHQRRAHRHLNAKRLVTLQSQQHPQIRMHQQPQRQLLLHLHQKRKETAHHLMTVRRIKLLRLLQERSDKRLQNHPQKRYISIDPSSNHNLQ